MIVRTCRGCGCTDDDACWPPCFWVDQLWCSACEHRLGRRLTALAAALAFIAAALSVLAGALATAGTFQTAVAAAIGSIVTVVSAALLGNVGKHMLEVAP